VLLYPELSGVWALFGSEIEKRHESRKQKAEKEKRRKGEKEKRGRKNLLFVSDFVIEILI
jgi:hypothetical protein